MPAEQPTKWKPLKPFPAVVPQAQFRQGDFARPVLLGMFLGWEEGYGTAGVYSALHSAPDNTTGFLWANSRLPPVNEDEAGLRPTRDRCVEL